MDGQSKWNNAGSSTNSYAVRFGLHKTIWKIATYRTIFGMLNIGRTIKTVKTPFNAKFKEIDQGNDSPIWEKNFEMGNEVRFTMVKDLNGRGTYGEANVKTGDFLSYMHDLVHVIQHDTLAHPVPGAESQQKIRELIPDLVKATKEEIARWMAYEIDFSGIEALLLGASRGLLSTSDGGMGITLPGGSAGGIRSCYNTFVASESGLTTPSFTASTHESNLATALGNLTDDDAHAFDYEFVEKVSWLINDLNFTPAKIGNDEYRAVGIADRRCVARLTKTGGTLETKWREARERARSNPALNKFKEALVVDDMLIIPARQVEKYRPDVDGSTVVYGPGIASDPRTFTNTSNLCPTVWMGAGALLRGRRPEVSCTEKIYDHNKGGEYSCHWHDGWKRREWTAQDGTSKIENDSSLVTFNYDPGFNAAFSA